MHGYHVWITIYISYCYLSLLGHPDVLQQVKQPVAFCFYQVDPVQRYKRSQRQQSGGSSVPEPVSYTHLDVYKRQGYICAVKLRSLLLDELYLTNDEPKTDTGLATALLTNLNCDVQLLIIDMSCVWY